MAGVAPLRAADVDLLTTSPSGGKPIKSLTAAREGDTRALVLSPDVGDDLEVAAAAARPLLTGAAAGVRETAWHPSDDELLLLLANAAELLLLAGSSPPEGGVAILVVLVDAELRGSSPGIVLLVPGAPAAAAADTSRRALINQTMPLQTITNLILT
jgi:hypothetical protein